MKDTPDYTAPALEGFAGLLTQSRQSVELKHPTYRTAAVSSLSTN